jgi:hypothetical protein
MTRRSSIAHGCALAIALGAAHARADDSVAIRLSYRATERCPSAAAFLAQVAARTPLARPAREDEPATALNVVLTDVPGGNAGTLEVVTADGVTSRREVSAADCAQVASALALMTALAIDPNASMAPAPAPAPAQPEPAPAPAPRPATKPAVAQHPPRVQWVFAAGVLGEAMGGLGPELALSLRPFVQLARETDSAFSQALRLSASRAHADITAAEGSGGGDFTLWTVRLEACPLRVSPLRPLALSACLPVDAGQLEAEGKDLVPSERVTRPWLTLGGTARVEWAILPPVAVEAAGTLFFPLVRDRFAIHSDVALYRAPAVAGSATVGFGVRFP